MGTGLKRPLSSGSPSFIRMHSIADTLPFRQINRTGAPRYCILMPSCSAASTSAEMAGISARVRRYKIVTFSAPSRRAVLAESIAELPPPITVTFCPTSTFRPAFTSCRNVMLSVTPSESSPSTPSLVPACAPIAIITASKPFFSKSCDVTSDPKQVFSFSSTP